MNTYTYYKDGTKLTKIQANTIEEANEIFTEQGDIFPFKAIVRKCKEYDSLGKGVWHLATQPFSDSITTWTFTILKSELIGEEL